MKDNSIQTSMEFIKFNHESEGFDFDEEIESLCFDVLSDEMSADEAITWVVENYDLRFEESSDHNFFNLEDEKLDKIESIFVAIRSAGILARDHSKETLDFEYLVMIHDELFSDLYPYAGQIRTNVIKTGKMYCLPKYINSSANEIFEKLKTDRYLKNLNKEEFINDLAYYMGEIVALHPFVDGNARAARLFFILLAKNAGYNSFYEEIDYDRFLEGELASLEGDYESLIFILSLIISDS